MEGEVLGQSTTVLRRQVGEFVLDGRQIVLRLPAHTGRRGHAAAAEPVRRPSTVSANVLHVLVESSSTERPLSLIA